VSAAQYLRNVVEAKPIADMHLLMPPNKAMHSTALRAASDCQGVRRARVPIC
jgi:hypothetical protein